MLRKTARQIAEILNAQNHLLTFYNESRILNSASNYIILSEEERIHGFVKIRTVQWYQGELSHLSVLPEYRRRGLGSKLIRLAEERAKERGLKLIQCSINFYNKPSKSLFEREGYRSNVSFFNVENKSHIVIYQKGI